MCVRERFQLNTHAAKATLAGRFFGDWFFRTRDQVNVHERERERQRERERVSE